MRAWRLLWARMCVCRAGAVLVCLCVCVCCMGGMWVASPLGAERLKAAQPQGAFKCGVWGRGAGGSWLVLVAGVPARGRLGWCWSLSVRRERQFEDAICRDLSRHSCVVSTVACEVM